MAPLRSPIWKALGAIVLSALSIAGCRELLVDPAPAGPPTVAVSFSLAALQAGGGPQEAYDKADQVQIQLTRDGAPPIDLVQPFASSGSETRIPISVELTSDSETARLGVALLAGGAAIFTGETSVALVPGATVEAQVSLVPVPASVLVRPESGVELSSLGATSQLSAVALFATGDTIPSLALAWSSGNATVAEVSASGLVTARGEGDAEIVAAHGAVSGRATIRVRQAIARVEISPESHTLQVGRTVQLTASPRDPGGSPVQGRTAQWVSSNPQVASVSSTGLVSAVAAGAVTITATVEDQSGTSAITVAAPPFLLLGRVQIDFEAEFEGPDPAAETVGIVNGSLGELGGVAIGTVTYDGPVDGWLVASLSGSQTPAILTLRPSTSRLPVGTYSALVQVVSPEAANSPQSVLVTLTVALGPRILLSPDTVTFFGTQGASEPLSGTVAVGNDGDGLLGGLSLSSVIYSGPDSGWLSASLSGSMAPTTISLTAAVGNLDVGTYGAQLYVFGNDANNSPQPLYVQFLVASGDPCALRGSLVAGDTVAGTLTADSCLLDEMETYADRWEFVVEEGDYFEIGMTSSDFGPLLILEAADGEWLDVGWSDGSDTAYAFAFLGPGTYIVWAATEEWEAIGSYQLWVNGYGGSLD